MVNHKIRQQKKDTFFHPKNVNRKIVLVTLIKMLALLPMSIQRNDLSKREIRKWVLTFLFGQLNSVFHFYVELKKYFNANKILRFHKRFRGEKGAFFVDALYHITNYTV